MDKHLPAVPAVHLTSRLQLATFFPPSSRGGRRGSAGPPPPPALMADIRVVIRRHFPVGPDNRIVEKVAEDIALRRQQSRKLRRPERVERALAADVLPLVKHPFDRGAVVAARNEVCAYVSGACADPRLAKGGVQVLVLLDIFACPTLFLPPPCKRIRNTGPASAKRLVVRTNPCMEVDLGSTTVPAKKPPQSVGTIGDRRRLKPVKEERFEGWLPW